MPPKATATAAGRPRKTKAKKTGVPKNNSLYIPVSVSPELEAVIGKGPYGRADITRKIWDYIKKHNLQDPNNRTFIIPDAKLSAVLGKNAVYQMKLQTLLKKHIG